MVKKNYAEAFKIIIEKALEATPKNHITIIYDESFAKLFDSLLHVVNLLNLSATFIFIPKTYQNLLQRHSGFMAENGEVLLPNGLKAAISNSDIILNLLDGVIESSKVRGAVLNQKKDKNCKVAHCPGLSSDVLNIIIKSPFKKIIDQCELMAWALGNSYKAELITHDAGGRKYVLEMGLDGWNNEPLMSPGVIYSGSWGNIPPGEAFCCPRPKNVNGKICINGSLPGIKLKKDEEVVLTFLAGKLMKWQASKGSVADNFFTNLEKVSKKRKDANWNMFAEFGIGLNPAITSLTGNSLFDEKMAGTIHIAIGDNINFGHNISSHIHADLVVSRPSLFLDDTEIISEGKINSHLLRNRRKQIKFNPIKINNGDIISIRSIKIKVDETTIKRKLSKGDRIGYINILNGKYKHVTAKLKYELEDDTEIKFQDLLKRVGARNKNKLVQFLEALHHYHVINIIRPI